MPESQTPNQTPQPIGEGKGIRFQIKTGGQSYHCTLQDRAG